MGANPFGGNRGNGNPSNKQKAGDPEYLNYSTKLGIEKSSAQFQP
jgi:hypothetical protein